MNNRGEEHPVRRQKKSQKIDLRRQHFTNLGKAANMIREEVGKDGEREHIVELFAEQTQLETIAYRQMRTFVGQADHIAICSCVDRPPSLIRMISCSIATGGFTSPQAPAQSSQRCLAIVNGRDNRKRTRFERLRWC